MSSKFVASRDGCIGLVRRDRKDRGCDLVFGRVLFPELAAEAADLEKGVLSVAPA